MRLYRQILGNRWSDLDPLLREYLDSDNVHAIGEFMISNGSSLFSRFIARLLRLPNTAEKANVKLDVNPKFDGEMWRRSFPGQDLTSVQSISPDQLLIEDFGTISFAFRLVPNKG